MLTHPAQREAVREPGGCTAFRIHSNSTALTHPDSRMIVLANRPGHPFLGNDFFREIGDVLSCHVIDNPDRASELQLLRAYGPTKETIRNPVYVFRHRHVDPDT